MCMHELDRVGELSGTVEQLARAGRCSPVQLTHALTDLQTTGAADVTQRNDIVTVINRRMSREHKQREGNTLRQERFRRNGNSNGTITPHTSEIRDQKSESTHDPSTSPRARTKIERDGESEGNGSFQTSEKLRSELNSVFQRSTTARWSYLEEQMLSEITSRPDCLSEWREIKTFRATTNEPRFCVGSRTLKTLLEKWTEALDQSRQPPLESAEERRDSQKLMNKLVPKLPTNL